MFLLIILIIAFVSVFLLLLPHNSVYAANVEDVNGEVRAVIGSTSSMTAIEAQTYKRLQESMLTSLSTDNPNDFSKAVIIFNDFISVEELEDTIGKSANISKVYIWVPNKTGRAIITVYNNDIENSINKFFSDLDLGNETNESFKNDMLDLVNNYGIFAVEITETNESLASINSAHIVDGIDLFYNPYALEIASQSGKVVSYICVPDKPDGTH